MSRSYGERASSPQAAYHSLLPVATSCVSFASACRQKRMIRCGSSPHKAIRLCGGTCWEHVAGMGAGSLFGENGNGEQTEERMIENPYKRLPPLERRPDGTPYRMTPAQRKRANALIRRECCNCEDGNCIVLDDGDTCTCPQMISFSVCCKWFRWAELSRKNGWTDEYGRIYLYYPICEVVELLHCGRQKAVNTLWELQYAELIEIKKQGCGKPNCIYPKSYEAVSSTDFKKSDFGTPEG